MYMNRDDRRVLRSMFGHRVRFDESERRLYESDLWRPPSGVRRFIRSLPEAVVLPENESELVDLLAFAQEINAPLVPRGGGTALNGGSMPIKGGIVVDFALMDQRFEPHEDGEEVVVGAGTTFQDLKTRLAHLGRALVVEPIFPEATTVGGWLATGGPGFGSNRFGFIEETVRSVRVVLPDGSRRVFSGSELEVISGICGSTAFITAVTLRTRKAQEPVPFVASFDSLASLSSAWDALCASARWWTLMVETPETASLKAEAMATRPPARNAFMVTGAVLADEWTEDARKTTTDVVTASGGKVLDAKKTTAWWGTHKEVYRAKTLGPSMVGTSALVPTKDLLRALSHVHDEVRAPHWLMTGIVAGDESMLIGYALDDERRPTHQVAYGAVLAMDAALKGIGGWRPVSLGIKDADKSHLQFSEDRLERIAEFQGAVDPKGLMNPGKVFGTPIVRYKPSWAPGPTVQGALRPGQPVLRALHGSTYVQYQRREEARAAYKAGLSAALGSAGGGAFGAKWAWEAVAADMDCSLRHASASARAFGSMGAGPFGWLHWVKRYLFEGDRFSEYQYRALMGEGFAAEAEVKSRLGLRFSDLLVELKTQLLGEGYRPVKEHRVIAENCRKSHNELGRANEERAAWAEGLDLSEKGPSLLFVDDAVSFEAPGFAREAVRLLKGADEGLAYLGQEEWSSGHALIASGQLEAARPLIEHNMKAVKASGAKTVVTLDPWTHHLLIRYYPRFAAQWGLEWDVKVRHVYEVLAGHAKAGKLSAPEQKAEVALHHPPVFRLHGIDEATAQAALALFGYDAAVLPHHGRDAMDVGASGAVAKVYPEIPRLAGAEVLRDAAMLKREHVVSSDPTSGVLLRDARDLLQETEGVPLVHLLGEEPPVKATEGDSGSEEAGEGGQKSQAEGKGDGEGQGSSAKAEASQTA